MLSSSRIIRRNLSLELSAVDDDDQLSDLDDSSQEVSNFSRLAPCVTDVIKKQCMCIMRKECISRFQNMLCFLNHESMTFVK